LYDIVDNPATRLKKDEWDRVVAVICQGASWQFKGWRYSDPVDLFSRTFGFYVGLEGAAVPNELQGWNVKTGKVSRDRRGMDDVCLASFWNGLEEFMSVHKQGYIMAK
jgi:parafibromin